MNKYTLLPDVVSKKLLDEWQTVDQDETPPRSAASRQGLQCLLRPVCLNTYGKYDFCNLELHQKYRGAGMGAGVGLVVLLS